MKEREQRAEEIFQAACDEGRSRSRSANVLPLWGSDDSFHFNSLLLRNTIQSPYFQKCCQKLNDWNAVIDEIYYEVKSLTPFQVDRTPSSAFCLLLRLLTMRMTSHQVDLTLKHVDSPYIRGIGFLYLRYAGPPDQAWKWVQPYLQDEEEIKVEGGHRASAMSMGEFVRNLFSQREYYGTPLPRLPVAIERDLQVKFLQAEKVSERAAQHFKNADRMKHFQTLGSQVMALYGDEENPIEWYKAVVDRVIVGDESSGVELKYPRFVVTFSEYGNTETVTLGEMDVMEGDWKHSGKRDSGQKRDNRGYGRRDRHDNRHLYEEVRRRERDTATADRGWARRPPSAKNSLSRATSRRPHTVQDEPVRPRAKHAPPKASPATAAAPPSRKRTPEELAAIAEKKRKLMAKYG